MNTFNVILLIVKANKGKQICDSAGEVSISVARRTHMHAPDKYPGLFQYKLNGLGMFCVQNTYALGLYNPV